MLRAIIALALAALLATPALADMTDDQYVDDYFGTTALLFSPTQLADPNYGWWGDKLPPQLVSDYGFVIGVVNTLRSGKGVTPLLDPALAQVIAGWEEQVEGGFNYNIDFIDMRPSEVAAVFTALGGIEKFVPGVKLSYRPLLTRSYYFSTMDLKTPLTLTIGQSELSFTPTSAVSEVQAKIAAAFREQYGQDVNFDLYFSQYIHIDGTSGADISIYAEMPAG